MRKLPLLLVLLAVPAFALPTSSTAAPGYTRVTATNISDDTGTPLQSGTATFQIVDTSGNPMSVKLGTGGQVTVAKATAQVTYGSFTADVVDVSLTLPSFPCMSLTITDNATGTAVWGNTCLQPTGSNYSLDQFSTNTAAIYPQAGATLPGNLQVNGNLGITGTLILGGLNTASLTATSINGALNAAQFGGVDIGAKVMAAFASCVSPVCAVEVPVGSYSYSTDIVLPNKASTTLKLDAGAVLQYNGSGYAIRTAPGPAWGGGTYQGRYSILGPGLLLGNSSAKAGVLLYPGTNGTLIADIGIDNFSGGDCIVNAGTNSAQIIRNKMTNCLVGFHNFGTPAYASNLVHVADNTIANNRWGVINGDISNYTVANPYTGTTGVSSPMYGVTFEGNDFEANTVGAAWEGLTVGSQYRGNYIEANPRGIVLGMTVQPLTNAIYTALYGTLSNGGTAKMPKVDGNYFTTATSTHALVEVRAAFEPIITANATDGVTSSACFVDLYIGTKVQVQLNEDDNVGALLCQGGGPGWNQTNLIPAPISVSGAITSSGDVTTSGNVHALLGYFGGGATSASPLVTIGAGVIYNYTSAPAGACTGSTAIAFGTWGLAACKNGSWVIY